MPKDLDVSYSVALDNEMDLAIQRLRNDAPQELLVLLPSQNQYYIRNFITGSLSVINKPNLEGFFDSLYKKTSYGWENDTLYTNCKWLPRIIPEKVMWEGIPKCISDERFVPAVKSGLFNFDRILSASRHYYFKIDKTIDSELDKCSASWRFMRSYKKNFKSATEEEIEYIEYIWPAIRVIMDHFGIDDAREWGKAMYESKIWTQELENTLPDAMKRIFETPITKSLVYVRDQRTQSVSTNRSGDTSSSMKPLVFDFKRVLEYSTKSLVAEDYNFAPADFWTEWFDTLSLQTYCFDRVVDKYPKMLRSTHQALSAMASRMQFEVDPDKEAAAVARMSKLDYTPQHSEYFFTHPKAMSDLRTEAQQQSNCLASYIDSVSRGDTQILFLRKKSDPDHAHITIEVDMENRIVQALGKFNCEPSDADWTEIAKWAKARNLTITPVQGRLEPACARYEAAHSKKDKSQTNSSGEKDN